ncbi:MAG: tRNA 2-thiouridine(34) synthase MnmA [Nanoarchaeota archaeon]
MEKKLKNVKNKKTVVIGLSGGVDSAVSTLLLKKQGYNVIAAFMKNFSDTKNPYTGECSYLEDKKMAQRIASLLKIRFIVFDFEKQYKKYVIDEMYKSYSKGLTPNPDILCNKVIKFPLFWKEAKKLGADYIAMGHYARIKKTSKGYNLLAGKDKKKDQSYFLSDLSQSDLKHALFPLGNLTKQEVRNIAKKNHFPNWNKHGTVGICFVGQIDMQSFLKKKIKPKKGMVKDSKNNIIGTHIGISFYTIGQKVGEHVGIKIKKSPFLAQKRFYIAKKIKPNILIVAPEGNPMLKNNIIKIKNLHLINPYETIKNKNLKIRIRHLGQLHQGKLINNKFILKKPIESIAPGQIAVFYDKDKIIASAKIK